MLGAVGVGAEDAQAADEDGHLRRGQGEELRLVDEELLGGDAEAGLEVVAEAVGDRLEDGEGGDVGLLVGGVGAAGGEGDGDVVAGLARRRLDGGGAAEDDEVGERDLLAVGLGVVERLLDACRGCRGPRRAGRAG